MDSEKLLSKFAVPGVSLLLLCLLAPRFIAAVYLNLTARELASAMSGATDLYPYAFGADNIARARHADRIATDGLSLAPASTRLDCLRFRAQVAVMDWQAAWSTARTGACTDASLQVPRAPWEAIQVVDQLQRGERNAALVRYHRALAEGSGLLSASLDSLMRPLLADTSKTSIYTLQESAPRFLVGAKINHEWQPAPQPVSASWALVGYDVDESALETGEPVNTVLFWQPLRGDVIPGKGWVRVGALWRQEVRLVNLVPDAGFEWLVGDGVTAWQLPASAAQVISTKRAENTTHALEIQPAPAGGGAVASTPVLPIGAHCAYLMGGWVRSQGAAPVFSIVWDGLKNNPDDPPYINLMEGPRDMEWTHISTLVQPKAGARGVMVYAGNWAALWLDLLRPPRTMAVDNIFLIPISLPNSPECILNEH